MKRSPFCRPPNQANRSRASGIQASKSAAWVTTSSAAGLRDHDVTVGESGPALAGRGRLPEPAALVDPDRAATLRVTTARRGCGAGLPGRVGVLGAGSSCWNRYATTTRSAEPVALRQVARCRRRTEEGRFKVSYRAEVVTKAADHPLAGLDTVDRCGGRRRPPPARPVSPPALAVDPGRRLAGSVPPNIVDLAGHRGSLPAIKRTQRVALSEAEDRVHDLEGRGRAGSDESACTTSGATLNSWVPVMDSRTLGPGRLTVDEVHRVALRREQITVTCQQARRLRPQQPLRPPPQQPPGTNRAGRSRLPH